MCSCFGFSFWCLVFTEIDRTPVLCPNGCLCPLALIFIGVPIILLTYRNYAYVCHKSTVLMKSNCFAFISVLSLCHIQEDFTLPQIMMISPVRRFSASVLTIN